MRRYCWEFLVSVLLLTGVAVVFHRVLQADFVRWDDDILIYNNPHLTGWNAATLRWAWEAFDYVVRYQPLGWLTWAAIIEVAGKDPQACHGASLAFHGLNTVLVFWLIRALLRRWPAAAEQEDTHTHTLARVLCAGAGALLWAVHPMRVETVAWASALLHCQAAFFLLTATLLYLHAHGPPATTWRRRLGLLGSVTCFAAAVLSYPMALGFVIVPIVLDVWILRRVPSELRGLKDASVRRVWLEKLPFLGIAAVVLAITLWTRFNVSGGWIQTPSMAEFSLAHRLMQACYVWAYYVWKPCLPFELAPVYTTLLSFRPTAAPFGLSLMFLLLLGLVLFAQRRRWPGAVALGVSHLVVLVPVLGLTEHPHYPSDRYSYLASVLWSIALASTLSLLASKPRHLTGALAGCLALALGFAALSDRQTRLWQNSETLFRYTLAQLEGHPYRADIHWRLGMAQADADKLDEAVRNYQAALGLLTGFGEVHYHLGLVLERQQKSVEALEHYLMALRILPDYPEAHRRAGSLLAARGNNKEAEIHFQRAVALEHSPARRGNWATVLLGAAPLLALLGWWLWPRGTRSRGGKGPVRT